MADVEAVSCIKNEVFVYRIPARSSNRGYRAAEWKLDQPDWTGRLRVCTSGTKLTIRLDDKNTGELFAQCPVDGYPGPAIEQVLDSSRYFVIRLQDDSGRSAFIGIGFADRGDSFDLLVSIQDHFKWVKREALQVSADEKTAIDPGPKLDLGFKEGQTIKLNIATKKKDDNSKPKPKAGGLSGGLLPPPPGGVKIAPPSRAPPSTVSPQHQPHNTLVQPASSAPSSQLLGSNNADLLMGLSAPTGPSPPMQAAQGQSGSDPWGDFASAGNQQRQQQPQQDSNWVSFE